MTHADSLSLRRGDKIVLATHNAGKLQEFRNLFAPHGIDFVSAGELGVAEPVEDGTTFVENARIKAHATAKATGQLSLADDSGISITALNGAPGVYTADWAQTENGRDWNMAIQRAKDELDASGSDDWSCSFNSTLCLAHPDGRELVFEGNMPGTFVWPPRGGKHLGFDPVFQPDGSDMTYGQLWEEAQAGRHVFVSHRTFSFRKLVQHFGL